ncbi:uncharacterized protein KGF55_000920 [Candida pseudojiufengensis]|uniref:uncharacterized protein n=1 Tax=Candida pseudojiufengensis TaxID=497109 RepID=UPI0022257B35|nr:uncharacterized protein KGF55_000920 [Candida pseudojiufengensis]KAI5965558.1 hypothetical protein KGF55_000920 [Candida pseudojiufengensis]
MQHLIKISRTSTKLSFTNIPRQFCSFKMSADNSILNQEFQVLHINDEQTLQSTNQNGDIKTVLENDDDCNTNDDDDEIILPQQSKTNKQRKPQTEEEYQYQLKLWQESGPQINTENWLYEEIFNKKLDPNLKINRVKILHGCEKAYYNKDWVKCLEICKIGSNLFNVDLNEVGETMKHNLSLEKRRQRISNKIERHIVDLYNIQERCLERIREEEEEEKEKKEMEEGSEKVEN